MAVGDKRETMQQAFGDRGPASQNEPIIPANQDIDEYRGPVSFSGSDEVYRYDGVSVFVTDGAVEGFMVTSRGSQTTRGLTIGIRSTTPGVRIRISAVAPPTHGGWWVPRLRRAAPQRPVGSGSAATRYPTSRSSRARLEGVSGAWSACAAVPSA